MTSNGTRAYLNEDDAIEAGCDSDMMGFPPVIFTTKINGDVIFLEEEQQFKNFEVSSLLLLESVIDDIPKNL